MSGKINFERFQKAAVITALTITLSGLALGISDASVEKPLEPGDSLNFSFQAEENASVSVKLLPPRSEVKTINLSASNKTYWKNISGEQLSTKGLYGYRISTLEEEYPPDSFLYFPVASLNQTLKNKTLNSSRTQHTYTDGSRLCPYRTEEDFSCEYEHFQAKMILSSAVEYTFNRSSYVRSKFYNFTLGQYNNGSETFYGTCPQEDEDFDCGNNSATPDTVNASAGTRQGSLIHALWKSYDLVGNTSVKYLASNYTSGSAETCNVWNNSFQCDTGRGQGSMALGYWTAFEQTGNETYREFAINLTSTDYSHPRIISAYLEAYSHTSNKSYLVEAEERTEKWLENCPNCSSQEFAGLKNALWRGYMVTGDYGYYRNAVNLTGYSSSKFCSWNSSSCDYPNVQGLTTLNYWRAYRSQKDEKRDIFNPDIDHRTIVGENLSIDISMQGRVSSPEVLYRERESNKSWKSCRIGFFDGCVIPGENLSQQTPYSFKFSAEGLEFPKNGSLVFAPSLVKDSFVDEAREFTDSDPNIYCQPSQGDYTCEGEVRQSSMILGFSQKLQFDESTRHFKNLRNLIEPPYVVQSGITSLCSVENSYLSCSTGGIPSYQGSTRQGSMIDSLFEAYQLNGNNSHYSRALNYSLGEASDCDVWGRTGSRSYTCGSSEGQAAMIQAYLEAYRVTGNSTFRQIAFNLTENAENTSNSQNLGSALWESTAYFNTSMMNYSVLNRSENITEEYSDYCSGNCSPEEYAETGRLSHHSYIFSGGNYSDFYRNTVLNTTEEDTCGPFKVESNCQYPNEQGGMIKLFSDAAYTMPVKLKVEDRFNLSKDSLNVGESFSATCSVENRLQDTNITGLSFEVLTGEGISANTTNNSYSHGVLEFNQSAEYSWNFSAVSSGISNVTCVTESDTAYRNKIISEVNVTEKSGDNKSSEEPEDPSSGSSGSGGGGGGSDDGGGSVDSGSGGLVVEPVQNKTFSYNNSSTEISWSVELLETLGVNTTYRQFKYNKSCFSASRGLYRNSSSLYLNYSCKADGLILLDKVPENFSTIDRESYSVRVFNNSSIRGEVLEYSERGSADAFSPPLVLESRFEIPPVQVDANLTKNLARENSSLIVKANLSRSSNCTISRNEAVIYEERTDEVNQEIRLTEGNNSIEFSCGQSFSRSENILLEKTPDKSLPLGFILKSLSSAILLSIVSAVVYFRREIYSRMKQTVFEYYMGRFESAMEEGDQAKAIKLYSRISMLRDEQIGKIILESDLELMRGLRIYLILDLLEDDEVANSSIPIGGDIESLVERFLEDTEDEKLERMIEEKLAEVSELNNRK